VIASWFSLGGRFPALKVFALPALSVLLGLVVLWGLKPWEDDSDGPRLVPLGIEMAVDDGKAFPSGSTGSVAAGIVAPKGPQGPKLVVQSGKPVERDRSGGAVSALAVAPGQAVTVAEVPSSPQGPAPGSGAGEEVPSVGATDVEAPPEGTSSPAALPVSTDGGGPGGPVASGGGPIPESCEGDEYLVTVTFLDEEPVGEESPVEILLQRLSEDGSVEDELTLEGVLSDARSLVVKLSVEGSCVELEIAQPDEAGEGEGEEGEEEAPEAGEEVTEPAELPDPASP
jgi:hypothetical protein